MRKIDTPTVIEKTCVILVLVGGVYMAARKYGPDSWEAHLSAILVILGFALFLLALVRKYQRGESQ
jgi:hypothetical protein